MEQNVLEYDKEKLNRFIEAVNEDIEDDVAQMLTGAKETAEKLLSDAEKESSGQARLQEEESLRRLEGKITKRLAKAELDSKKKVLLRREELTGKLFSEIKEMLRDFCKTPEYEKFLKKTAEKVSLSGGGVILVRKEDLKLSSVFEDAGLSCPLQEDDTIAIGGFSVFYPATGLLDNKTLDLALEEAEDKFRRNNCFHRD